MPFERTFRAHLALDGCETMEQIVARFRCLADEFQEMAAAGVSLECGGDDYFMLTTDNPTIADKFGFEEWPPEDEGGDGQ